MCQLKMISVMAILIFFVGQVNAKPLQDLSRHKRTSDQRLAELETLIALGNMKGKFVTIPIGFGKIDPDKIGRRRRSVSLLLQQLINDLSAEDKLSDEVIQLPEYKEEDGGEEKDQLEEERLYRRDNQHLVIHPHIPIRLPE